MNKNILGIFVLAILTIGTFPFSNGDVTAADATTNSNQTMRATTPQTQTASNEPQVQQQGENQQQQESEQVAQEDRQVVIPNHPPRANAGSDKKVNEGANIILDARRSSDPDAGDKISYLWRQISGPGIALENTSASIVSFTAPEVTKDRSVGFVLIARDDKGAQGTDSVKVSINNLESTIDTTSNNIGTVQKNDNTNTNTNTNTNSNPNTNNNPNPRITTTTTNPPGLENATNKALTNAETALRNNGSRVITPTPTETQVSRSSVFTPQAMSTGVSAVQADNIVNTRTAYDIIFRTASVGFIKTIEMTFPAGTNIGSATMLEVSGIGPGSTSSNGQTLTYTVHSAISVPSGVYLRFEAWKILNPPNPGTFNVQVVTKDSGGSEIDSGTSASYQIKQIVTADIANNAIIGSKILDGTVTSADISPGTFSGGVADNSVTSAKVVDGQIMTADVADNAITGAKIQDSQVGTADITDNAITSPKILDGQVDGAVDIAVNSIPSDRIKDGTINQFDLTPGAVTLQTSIALSGIATVLPLSTDPEGPSNTISVVSRCPAGFKVTGGGFSANVDQGRDTVFIKKSAGFASPGQEGWEVVATNYAPRGSGLIGYIEVQAMCAKTFP